MPPCPLESAVSHLTLIALSALHLCTSHSPKAGLFRSCLGSSKRTVLTPGVVVQDEAFESTAHCVVSTACVDFDTQQGDFFTAFMCFVTIPETPVGPGS